MSGSGLDILHEAGFGDLQIQCAPIQPVAVQGTGDHLAQVRVVQLHGGQIHGHAQVRQPVTLPVPQLAAGLVQHPFAYGDDDAALLGQRDEQVRWYQPPLRVIPAQQRLDAHHPVAVQGYLWLVDQMELVVQQRIAQTRCQLTAHAHLAVDTGDVELIAVARAGLGQHHRLLGLLQQLARVHAIVGEQGYADGGLQGDARLIQLQRHRQVIENLLGQLGHLVGLLDIGDDQRELVAAQPCDAGQPPAVGLQALCHADQQAVASLVAESFVDFLEVIQPAAEDRHIALTALGVGQHPAELLEQQAAVGQAGQLIVARQMQQAGLGFATATAIALDGVEQLIDTVDQQPQLVFLLSGQHGHHHSAGMIGVDEADMLHDAAQRTGQQHVEHQIDGTGHRQRAQQTGKQDDQGIVEKALAIERRVEGQAQVAVVFVIGRPAMQLNAEVLSGVEQQVGEHTAAGVEQRPLPARQRRLGGVTDQRLADGGVGKQPFDDLGRHVPIKAEDGLGGRIVEHRQDLGGVTFDGFAYRPQVEDDLGQAQQHPCQQGPQQHQSEKLY